MLAGLALDAVGAAVLNVRWPRWSELSRVGRVGLYTRWSLYTVLWGFNASALLTAVVNAEDSTPVAELLGGGLVVTVCAHVALQTLLNRLPDVHPLPWPRLAPLLVASAAYVVLAELRLEGDPRGSAVLIAVASAILVFAVVPGRRILPALILVPTAVFGITGGQPISVAAGIFVSAFFVFTVRASLWLLGIVRELDDASRAKAELAVVEERLRFSRDVHDVLGRQLSTIAVQAELAATLAARGDERAAGRMLEVRTVAHEALREARELARGYRSTNFLNELEGARSLLRSAGIDVRLSVGALPRAWHEPAGWVVRESVTNVLRHSSAGCVRIAFADGELRIDNDGAHLVDGTDGSGLRGLRERLAPLGASLEAGAEGDHWIVVARFPGAGPLSSQETA
ncbi:sensor histidine kinase [Solirubrobacter sp. CPCC 204708]|uniref:Histidine kinase n=1 Tax=Solirubrobacter deserti TaxID=2282478 RepID=A0ABT4RIP1_9ACTN|nr:histidine kinase [Solirubrobacter deserti]MBE2320785.1 sensor histidine kinase [Solirubrobacter deserti]MDA0138420.1 histidine kinase [Solirubrobacter deserti]